jgi:hypothetical protein
LLTEESSYVLTVLDDYSRYAEIAIVRTNPEVAQVFKNVVAGMERQTNQKMQKVRFDRGSEFYGLEVWFAQQGIFPQPVPAGTPEAYGRAERAEQNSGRKGASHVASIHSAYGVMQ